MNSYWENGVAAHTSGHRKHPTVAVALAMHGSAAGVTVVGRLLSAAWPASLQQRDTQPCTVHEHAHLCTDAFCLCKKST